MESPTSVALIGRGRLLQLLCWMQGTTKTLVFAPLRWPQSGYRQSFLLLFLLHLFPRVPQLSIFDFAQRLSSAFVDSIVEYLWEALKCALDSGGVVVEEIIFFYPTHPFSFFLSPLALILPIWFALDLNSSKFSLRELMTQLKHEPNQGLPLVPPLPSPQPSTRPRTLIDTLLGGGFQTDQCNLQPAFTGRGCRHFPPLNESEMSVVLPIKTVVTDSFCRR